MRLPDNARCAEVIKALDGDPALNTFERSFVQSNQGRTEFSDKQRYIVAELLEKYEC